MVQILQTELRTARVLRVEKEGRHQAWSASSAFDIWELGATLNMVLQNQNKDPLKASRWIQAQWGELGEEIMDMIREEPTARMTEEELIEKLPLWRASRNLEYESDYGAAKGDFEWLVDNTENHFP
jgi:hypothetical protein